MITHPRSDLSAIDGGIGSDDAQKITSLWKSARITLKQSSTMTFLCYLNQLHAWKSQTRTQWGTHLLRHVLGVILLTWGINHTGVIKIGLCVRYLCDTCLTMRRCPQGHDQIKNANKVVQSALIPVKAAGGAAWKSTAVCSGWSEKCHVWHHSACTARFFPVKALVAGTACGWGVGISFGKLLVWRDAAAVEGGCRDETPVLLHQWKQWLMKRFVFSFCVSDISKLSA